jgi:hypothetical protein
VAQIAKIAVQSIIKIPNKSSFGRSYRMYVQTLCVWERLMAVNDDKMNVKAHEVIRLVPYLFLVSPMSGREVKIRISEGLKQPDAQDFVGKLSEDFADTPIEILTYLRRTALLEIASDWRFMTEAEIAAYLRRDVNNENGVGEPAPDEVPPDNSNEDF